MNVCSSRPAIDDTRIPLAAKPKKATARKDRADKDQELVLKNRERTEQDELEGISKEVRLFCRNLQIAIYFTEKNLLNFPFFLFYFNLNIVKV